MTDRPADVGRDRYFALQRLARSQGRDTQELLTLYALEGLLARLAASEYQDRFVLKGGMLLAAFGQRRPTRDLDVQATRHRPTSTPSATPSRRSLPSRWTTGCGSTRRMSPLR